MSITPTEAANAINYLLAARALTVTDNQGQVWADYLNHEVNDPQPHELLPACRRAIREWSADGHRYQIDVEAYAKAIRRTRQDNVDAVEQARGPSNPDGLDREPQVRNRWLHVRRYHLGLGVTPARADALAWAAIGRQPPPPAIGDGTPTGAARARAVLDALARGSRRP